MLIKDSQEYMDTYDGKWIDSDDEYEAKKKIKNSILTSLSASSFSFSASCGFDTIFSSLDMLIRDWKKESLSITFRIVWIKDEDDRVIVDSISLKYLSL